MSIQKKFLSQATSRHIKATLSRSKKAAAAINEAKRPLLYIGGGAVASNASEIIRKFMKKTGIPAVETLMALGVLDAKIS